MAAKCTRTAPRRPRGAQGEAEFVRTLKILRWSTSPFRGQWPSRMTETRTTIWDDRGSAVVRYLIPLAAVGLAAGTKHLLDRHTGVQTSYLPCFAAVMLSGWYGGLGPGLL